MLRMAQVQYIKDLYENEGKSLREISRITGHSFETVQKYAQKENWSEDNLPDTEPTSYPVLGKFIPIVDSWLEADRKVPRKQRHTAWRLFCRLRDEYGFTGSYSSVKRYVRKKKYVMKCALPGFVDSKNEEKTERNAGYLVVSHSGGGMLRQGTRKGIRRTPANRGMRAHWVVKGLDISEDVCHGMCP